MTWGAGQTPEEGAVRLPETRPGPLVSWTSEAGRTPEDGAEGAVRLPETHRLTLGSWVPGAGLYK